MNATETKHTAGPWFSVEDEDDRFDGDSAIITTDDRFQRSIVPIAKVGVDYSEPMAAEQRANARLIAAAPDMLAALKAMVLNDKHTYRDCHKAALAAIAKATGEAK